MNPMRETLKLSSCVGCKNLLEGALPVSREGGRTLVWWGEKNLIGDVQELAYDWGIGSVKKIP